MQFPKNALEYCAFFAISVIAITAVFAPGPVRGTAPNERTGEPL